MSAIATHPHGCLTSVRPKRGGLVHITSLGLPGRTVCGKECSGWVVSPIAGNEITRRDIECGACKAACVFKVKRKRKGAR